MAKEAFNPDNMYELPGLTQAIKVGNTIYVSGQVAWDKEMNVVGSDIGTQATQLFENMKGVLEAAGATMADIVKLNYYLANYDDINDPGFAEAYVKHFQPPFPTGVGFQVGRLGHPDLLIEIDAIAVVE